ncbi:hypothetical protein IAR55_003767 [Kwoniella newhampshirensis]|uniref:Peroxin-14 n=1 Tax=Kwoniella newhampshirensis TaxID=1651941 RepID=A0AAW0YKY1_9TREE
MSDPASGPPSPVKGDPTSNPLFGATPPSSTTNDNDAPAQPPSQVGSAGVAETSDPLFGASPPLDDVVERPIHSQAILGIPMSGGTRSYRGGEDMIPRSSLNSTTRSIPTFMRRVTFLLSLVLGISSTVAGIWSFFILPLLHASFSARKALVDQQSDRMERLVEGLRGLRGHKMYAATVDSGLRGTRRTPGGNGASEEQEKSRDVNRNGGEKEVSAEKKELLRLHEATLREIDSSTTSSQHEHDLSPVTPPSHSDLIPTPISSLRTLTTSLRALTTALDSTSTTRTSLISTLESYTSHLHRQLFVARPTASGFGGFSIGMGTLGANLSRESGGGGGGLESKGEEWDAVRKEVRAIKGMVLNRRSFAPTPGTNGVGT